MNRSQYIKGKKTKRGTATETATITAGILNDRLNEIKGMVKARLRDSKKYLRDEIEVRNNAPEEVPQNEYLRGHRDAYKEMSDMIKSMK